MASTGFSENAASSGDDWPMFQHDSAHTGFSTSYVPTTNLIVGWTIRPPNPSDQFAYHTPAIADGYLYITNEHYLFCINASSGKQKWSQSLTARIPFAKWGFSTAVSGGYVYTDRAAYNASTGQLLFNYAYNGSTSPTVADGVIYMGSDSGGVVALSATTGAMIWNKLGITLEFSPAVADGVVYLSSKDQNVYALSASTGSQIWHATGVGGPYSHTVIANGYVYINGYEGIVYCLKASTGARIWSYPAESGPFNSPAVADGYIYVGSYALNASTGAPVWNDTKLGGSSPALANGLVYVDYYNNSMVPGLTPFTESIYAFNASTGDIIWNYTFPGGYGTELVSSPVIADGMVYVGARDALYAFGTPAPTSTPSPSTPLSDLQLIVIVAVVVVVVLAVLFLVYRTRRNEAKSLPACLDDSKTPSRMVAYLYLK